MDAVITKVLSAADYSQLPDRCILSTPFHRKKHSSYGIILYCTSTQRWLLVRPKYSYAYFLFVSGMYRKTDIKTIMSFMTKEEILLVKDLYFGIKHFKDIYYGQNYEHALERFYQIRPCLRPYFSFSGVDTTPWTFPKGRLEHRETPWQCSLREFNEETGLDIFSLKAQCLCQDPIVETYVSFDHELYETKCWLYKIDEEVELVHPIGNEIDERRWVSTEEACIMLSQTKCEMLQTALYYIKHFPYFSI